MSKPALDLLGFRHLLERYLEMKGASIKGAGIFLDGKEADISLDYKGASYIITIKPGQVTAPITVEVEERA